MKGEALYVERSRMRTYTFDDVYPTGMAQLRETVT